MTLEKKLKGDILSIIDLTETDIEEMYTLMTRFYENVSRENFHKDLLEKKDVIILKDVKDQNIRGFSTLMVLNRCVDSKPVYALFSGDTIIDNKYWGQNEMQRLWGKYAFSLIDETGGNELYWLLLSKGYKTYRILPVFFKSFYPKRGAHVPPKIKRVMDTFAGAKFPEDYDPVNGLIKNAGKRDFLKNGIADIDDARKSNPDIVYFEERNPDWEKGDELVCVAELKKDNFNSLAMRIVKS